MAQARERDEDVASGRPAAPPRRPDRDQGHHRRRRVADDHGRGGVRASPAGRGRRGGRPPARGGRGHRRQDRRHPVRVQGPGADDQPLVDRAHARRVVVGLRGGRGRAPGPGGDRDADRGLDPAAVGVLRRGRPQGDARRRADGRRLPAGPVARPRGPDRAVRGRRGGPARGARGRPGRTGARAAEARGRARAVRPRRARDAIAPRGRGRGARRRGGGGGRGGAAGDVRPAGRGRARDPRVGGRRGPRVDVPRPRRRVRAADRRPRRVGAWALRRRGRTGDGRPVGVPHRASSRSSTASTPCCRRSRPGPRRCARPARATSPCARPGAPPACRRSPSPPASTMPGCPSRSSSRARRSSGCSGRPPGPRPGSGSGPGRRRAFPRDDAAVGPVGHLAGARDRRPRGELPRGGRRLPRADRGGQPAHQRGGPAGRRRPGPGPAGRRGPRPAGAPRPAPRRAVHDQGLARHGRRRHDRGHRRLARPRPRARRDGGGAAAGRGGILLGKTNTPEFTWANETDNDVYGRTSNPYDLDRTTGGSSGGSAAIVAAGGAPFDIGSDSGNSIRQPAHLCGVAGIKPTSGRVPRTRHWPGYEGLFESFTQLGPIARRVEDLELVLPIIAGPDGEDPHVVPVPLGIRPRSTSAACGSPGSATTGSGHRRPRRSPRFARRSRRSRRPGRASRSRSRPTSSTRARPGRRSSARTGSPGCGD